eukprot:6265867-Amphidinium_carterae.1
MLCLQPTFDSADLDRCNTLITGCPGGAPRAQFVRRVNSTPVVGRRGADQKGCGSQILSVPCEESACLTRKTVLTLDVRLLQ